MNLEVHLSDLDNLLLGSVHRAFLDKNIQVVKDRDHPMDQVHTWMVVVQTWKARTIHQDTCAEKTSIDGTSGTCSSARQ